MLRRQFVIAALIAPAAAASVFYVLWLAWLVVFVSPHPGQVFGDLNAAIGLFQTWPVIAVAFVFAFALEVVVGLPLLVFFQRLGWLSWPAFLAGGCAAAIVFYLVMRGPNLPVDLAVTVILVLVPGCIGALVFGYLGGWLTSRLSGPA